MTDATTPSAGASVDGGDTDSPNGDDASADTGIGGDSDDRGDAGSPMDAQLPAFATCTGEGGACSLPRSVCADNAHLLYFVNPRCVDGRCQAEVHSLNCSSSCVNGGCITNVTAK